MIQAKMSFNERRQAMLQAAHEAAKKRPSEATETGAGRANAVLADNTVPDFLAALKTFQEESREACILAR